MLKKVLLTPYRNVRCHLKKYSSQQPRNYRELFNLRHASLRNAIERAFDVDPDIEYINEVDEELSQQSPSKEETIVASTKQDSAYGEELRNQIAIQMWNDYEKPDTIKWKTKVVNNYDSLEELFAKDKATGQEAETTKEKRKCWMNKANEVQLESIIEIDKMVSKNEKSLENFGYSIKEFDVQHSKYTNKKHPQCTSISQGKKRKVSNNQELKGLKYALDNVAEAIREGNSIMQNSRTKVHIEKEIFNKFSSQKWSFVSILIAALESERQFNSQEWSFVTVLTTALESRRQ
ncbi:hypothetical protein RJ641_006324, partial [Dillenia turbinata]